MMQFIKELLIKKGFLFILIASCLLILYVDVYAGVNSSIITEVPDFVKGKWTGVVLEIKNKTTKKTTEYKINLHSEFNIPGSNLAIKVGDFLPDFKMNGNILTSASPEPNNPAVHLTVFEGGKKIFEGWNYSKFPTIQSFQNEKYSIIFKGGIPVQGLSTFSNSQIAKDYVVLLGMALDQFRLDVGRYPTSNEGLQALMKNPGYNAWKGPYLKKETFIDPWGRPYLYVSPGKYGDYDLFSLGKDGVVGGSDEDKDITSWGGIGYEFKEKKESLSPM